MGLVQTLREEGRFIGVQQSMQQGEAVILLRLLMAENIGEVFD